MKKLALAFLLLLASFGAHAAGPAQAVLGWDNYDSATISLYAITGFEVDRVAVPLGTTCTNLLVFGKITTVNQPQIVYTDNIPAFGKRYCYQVAGLNITGASGFSNAAGKDFPLPVPPAATGLIVQ